LNNLKNTRLLVAVVFWIMGMRSSRGVGKGEFGVKTPPLGLRRETIFEIY